MNPPDFTPPDWQARLDKLLGPVPGDDPCGPSLRYNPAINEIRRAREADDASLPLGDWERPLKRADWGSVQTLGLTLIEGCSKDLQVACWVLEAATAQHQLAGLEAGLELVCGLIEQHWDGLHPRLDDGDSEARVAPLAWLNETLPRVLRLEIKLMQLPDRKPPRLTLEDWERQGRVDKNVRTDKKARPQNAEPDLPTRPELVQLAGQPAALDYLQQLRDQLDRVDRSWCHLSALLDDRLDQDSPSLSQVTDMLRLMANAVDQLLAGRRQPAPPIPSTSADAMPPLEPAAPCAVAASPAVLSAANLVLDSRESAYLLLERIAEFLQQTEPHNPTPYLIRRALHWGRLPLPELMQEVLREEGDLNRLFAVLGLGKPPK